MLENSPRPQTLANTPILRVLPYRKRRHVGPFVFLDHIGPHDFAPGTGMAVMPHLHIGLSTITYVFEGAIVHRDGLGTQQTLCPGDVNWMKTGSGLAHSERSLDDDCRKGGRLHAVQAWMVLLEAQREAAPSFVHLEKDTLPELVCGAAKLRLIGGALLDAKLPVPEDATAFYADVTAHSPGHASLPHPGAEAGFYLLSGRVSINGIECETPRLWVFETGEAADIVFLAATQALWFGGPGLKALPVMWWNFVASSQARIETAKVDWQAGRFADVVGETGRMTLPDLPSPAPQPL